MFICLTLIRHPLEKILVATNIKSKSLFKYCYQFYKSANHIRFIRWRRVVIQTGNVFLRAAENSAFPGRGEIWAHM